MTSQKSNSNSARRDVFLGLLHESRPDVDVDVRSLTLRQYAYDASNYRLLPAVVLFPKSEDDVAAALAAATAAELPVVARGAGTTMAGNALSDGVVLDMSRHMNRVLAVRPEDRVAVVEAGARLLDLQREAARHGLMFAPDPSSGSRVTIGGMLGNDACGNHSVAYGRTSDHVLAVDGVLADGSPIRAHRGVLQVVGPRASVSLDQRLQGVVGRNLGPLRAELGRIPRQVSGYALHRLLPENGFDAAKMLVGSEGTLVVVTRATVRLVPRPEETTMMVVGYPDLDVAADDVPVILAHGPTAIEAMDHEIVAAVADQRLRRALGSLPPGRSWLYVELSAGESFISPSGVDVHPDAALAGRASRLLADLRASGRSTGAEVIESDPRRAALWRAREDGAGLLASPPSGPRSFPGWEDAAVSPERLGDYVRGFRALLSRHHLRGVLYGHFGAGCVHTRLDFDPSTPAGVAAMEAFVHDAAALLGSLGGSVSGEHGDGRARSQLLPAMYSPRLIRTFAEVKRLFDPQGVLNPGVIVEPVSLTTNLISIPSADDGPLLNGAARCIGVGRCVVTTGTGGMCPSYRVTRQERDSTRGRARALLDLAVSPPIDSADVLETLGECLSCKACATDCPTGVDMATYKSEFMYEHYRHRIRPRIHYALDWLPVTAAVAQPFASATNALLRRAPVRRAAARAAGASSERDLPELATRRRVTRALTGVIPSEQADVLLFMDTFSRRFEPEVAAAAVRVLSSAGLRVGLAPSGCCGVPWITSGQLGLARRVLKRTVGRLDAAADERPIVVLEPSCAAALVGEAPRLVPGDQSMLVSSRVRTFSQTLAELAPDWQWPRVPAEGVLQQHCHERSVLPSSRPGEALRGAGMEHLEQPAGCCGMAGTFGFQAEHYSMSMEVAQLDLAPALGAILDGPVVADGFGCREQIRHLGRRPEHLAMLIDRLLRDGSAGA
jgi:FAD/FMN-containing dehydrogenase/Fe-S oxidoreductase